MIRLNRPAPRPRADPIVALIDVVFFLLVFFMLVGRLDASAPFEVSPPVAGVGEPLPAGGLTVSLSRDGRLALDGRALPSRAALLEALRPRAGGDDPPTVRVNAHAALPLSDLLPLVTALEGIGMTSVVLVVTPTAP
ncbi:ExbD/TolR family protein [Rhodospira trueperi]|uniref:Biopolymer transport protein ExbD n=1 Tax=Rhodospira trueperi TaxID=69960 RepID=A0A1G7ATI2_9PROT|nr:biopolymer transporter ExbD [Rhodospira trueperi]SDE18022.1 biopolymer transport protein ExbD [Rhodospira trueperi]